MPAFQLTGQQIIPSDRSLDHLRKERGKQTEMQNVLLCRIFSAVDIDQISHCLECIEGNTKRKKQMKSCVRLKCRRKQRPHIFHDEIPVFQNRQNAEIQQKRQYKNAFRAFLIRCLNLFFLFSGHRRSGIFRVKHYLLLLCIQLVHAPRAQKRCNNRHQDKNARFPVSAGHIEQNAAGQQHDPLKPLRNCIIYYK